MVEHDEPLWSGRFTKPPAPEARALGRSLDFDVRLAPFDVEVSVAHAHALRDAGFLTDEELDLLVSALREIGAEIADGAFAFSDADEDIHSAIERGVTERLGDVGAKLHAGRSRNDLVVTDFRLWQLAKDWGLLLQCSLVRAQRSRARTLRQERNKNFS